MEANTISEHLSPPMYSEMPGDMASHAGAAEYTVLSSNGMFANLGMEGGDSTQIGVSMFQGADSGAETSRMVSANGFASYAPSQPFSGSHGGSFFGMDAQEELASTSSGKAVTGSYAASYPYNNMYSFEPQASGQSASSYMECPPGYEAYQNSGQYYENSQWPMQQQLSGYSYGYQVDPLQSETTYRSNYQYSQGKGNNFNHFPNGTLMDIFFPKQESSRPCYNNNVSFLNKNIEAVDENHYESVYPRSSQNHSMTQPN